MSCQAGSSLHLTIGEVSYCYDASFLLALLLALVVVVLFSITKFGESTVDKKDDDLLSQLLPKHLATPEEYSRALIFYLASMALTVTLLSLVGPRVIALGAKDAPEASAALPLFIALVMVGLLPNVPWLQQLELQLRRFAHERAFIPKRARATAERLASAEFDFSPYRAEHVLRSPAMRGVEPSDFSAPRDALEYGWARLSCLLYQVQRLQDATMPVPVDSEMLERYAKDLDNLALRRHALEEDVAQYRRRKAADPYHGDDELHRTIRKTLRQLYILLGCAVRLKLNDDAGMATVLRPFGFVLEAGGIRPEHKNVMIVGLAVMMVSLFAIAFTAMLAGQALRWSGHWTPSWAFPKEPFEPFAIALLALLSHGAALLTAERIRRRRLAAGRWFSPSGHIRRPVSANYILVAIASAAVAAVVLFVWSLPAQGSSVALAKAVVIFSMVPAVTGAFYAFHLDNVDLGTRPPRWREATFQALATGGCGLVAASADMMSGFALWDYVALSTVLAAAAGLSLGWYIPEAAARGQYDPLAEALEARLLLLKAEAMRRFGTAQRAARWLDEPHPGLDGKPPRAGVADMAIFEKAMSLLRDGEDGPPPAPAVRRADHPAIALVK